jgi:DNA replication and repair protein RecF
MLLHNLTVSNFRIFDSKTLDLQPGVNLLIGNNAAGKTTLLEAIYLLMAGSSFRAQHPKELMRTGSEQFHVETVFTKASVFQTLSYSFSEAERRVKHNGNLLTNASSLLGVLHAVYLAPHDLQLIKGAPAIRRHYLDLQLAQVDPLYVHHLTRYKKALKQRNVLLRRRSAKTIELFEETLAASASYIVTARKATCERLHRFVSEIYAQICAKEDLVLMRYEGPEEHSTAYYLTQYARLRPKEMELGYSLLGPHKDDLEIFLNGREAKLFASEGEMRSLAAALKLAEWEVMALQIGDQPLMLLDDFGISLDGHRSQALADLLLNKRQVVITSPTDAHQGYFPSGLVSSI